MRSPSPHNTPPKTKKFKSREGVPPASAAHEPNATTIDSKAKLSVWTLMRVKQAA